MITFSHLFLPLSLSLSLALPLSLSLTLFLSPVGFLSALVLQRLDGLALVLFESLFFFLVELLEKLAKPI